MSTPGYTNSELIDMIRKGGTERNSALVQLIEEERQRGSIARYFSKRGAGDADIEDIFFSALEDLVVSIQSGRFKSSGDIRGYLFGVCRNKWLNWNKKEQRNTFGDHIANHYVQRETLSAEEEIVLAEEWQAAWNRFQQLSEICRQILTLAFFENRTNEEIASIVEYKDERVVRVKKSKCLKTLWEMSA